MIDNGIPEGYIVIAACKDECVTKMSIKTKLWFGSMGSSLIWELGYREGFTFIGISGNESLAFEKQ